MNKRNFILVILSLSLLMAFIGHPLLAVACLFLSQFVIASPRGRLCAVTLSVPEISKDLLEAFKIEIPEVFGPNGLTHDFSSQTAVLGQTVYGHIAEIPVTGAYDPDAPAGGGLGWEGPVQDVTTVIQDVPVTLNQMPICSVKVSYLTGLATKGVPLYKAAIANVAYALSKSVLDGILSASLTNVSNSFYLTTQLTSLDTFETLRNQCNSQKMYNNNRMAIINSAVANGLGTDDRVRSSLFYNQLNGDEGYRTWKNLCGFASVREYGDFPQGGAAAGLAFDRRLAAIAVRRIQYANAILDELKIPKVIKFEQMTDANGFEMTTFSYQKFGTGDLIFGAAFLFGASVGNAGQGVGAQTDEAGCVIRT